MPNLTAHIGIAEDVAARLGAWQVDRHRGSLLLGSTAPDVRIITGGRRGDTNFSGLDSADTWVGVKGLFRAHPEMGDGSSLDGPTAAFVAGYICHLVSDQAWVVHVYRPFFGNAEVFDQRGEGNVLDRALQLELDRRAWKGLNGVSRVQDVLEDAEAGVRVRFLSPEVLTEWRCWVQEFLGWGFSWDRLRFMARRQYPRGNVLASQVVERFLSHVPSGLESIYRRVPRQALESFRAEMRQGAVEYLNRFLSGGRA